ncbi:hypothetical protein [Celeribacter sp.]|uniref:hypothetical protein n=1 Tax=Celeribacter sp. TaxID=1890673 RepID=UPI003A92E817
MTLQTDPLTAVDELATLRAQLAALKAREQELCDEILTHATMLGSSCVVGAAIDARIETRTPMRIDPARLPAEILGNRAYYDASSETVVLLWPKATPTAANERPSLPDWDAQTVGTARQADAPCTHVSVDEFAAPTPPETNAPRETIEEAEAPQDLKPTQHAELQPLSGLSDEELATNEQGADTAPELPAELTAQPQELDDANALEAQADALFAARLAMEANGDAFARTTAVPNDANEDTTREGDFADVLSQLDAESNESSPFTTRRRGTAS